MAQVAVPIQKLCELYTAGSRLQTLSARLSCSTKKDQVMRAQSSQQKRGPLNNPCVEVKSSMAFTGQQETSLWIQIIKGHPLLLCLYCKMVSCSAIACLLLNFPVEEA